ncbi:hypothetical protein J6590_092911 [Homalodisca vitripennis]|nr:hypothetical protein J6590_092911 [Homalodisca vitripennis]
MNKLHNHQGQPATDAPPLSTMLTMQQKAQCVIWYAESKSIVSGQRLFRRTYPGQTAPDNKAIVRWFNQFRETGTAGKKSRPGRPRTSEENRVLFSDEATFHINGCVNRHNCRVWGSQQRLDSESFLCKMGLHLTTIARYALH